MIIIRPAQASEASVIQTLLRETWQDTYGDHLSQVTLNEVYKNWQSVEFLTKQINNSEMYFPVAIENGKLLGIATARQDAETIFLFRLYVSPQYQRKGVGRLLLDSVIDHYPEANKIQLHVEVLNPKGKAFYAKQGFKEVKREQEKIANEVIDQLLMEKAL